MTDKGSVVRVTGRTFWRSDPIALGVELEQQLPNHWVEPLRHARTQALQTQKLVKLELEPTVLCTVLAANRDTLAIFSQVEKVENQLSSEEEALLVHPVPTLGVTANVVQSCNAAAAAVLGAAEVSQVLALPFDQIFPHVEEVERIAPEALQNPVESTLVDFSGRHRRTHLRVARQGAGYVIAFNTLDDSLIRSQPDQQGRLAGLGLLVAGVAHEINNPLTFVLPALSDAIGIVRDNEFDRKRELLLELLEDSLAATERVAGIARDLREFRKGNEQIERVDVNRVVVETLQLARDRLRDRVQIAHLLSAPHEVLANSVRLSQVILNLLLNAAQSVPEGDQESKVLIRTFQAEQHVHIAVTDNGVGIEEKKLKSIFDPFFSTKDQGSGLGLSVCAGIVKRLGGWIEVESKVGVGSTFTVVLPEARADSSGVHLESVPPPRELRSNGGLARSSWSEPPPDPDEERTRLLIIDDEPLVLRSINRLLGRNAEITQASGGWDGIRLLTEGLEVDFIVCDMVMDQGSGQEVWSWIKKHRPDLRQTFCFMTGMAPPGTADPSMPPVIHKPFNLAALRKALEGRRRDSQKEPTS